MFSSVFIIFVDLSICSIFLFYIFTECWESQGSYSLLIPMCFFFFGILFSMLLNTFLLQIFFSSLFFLTGVARIVFSILGDVRPSIYFLLVGKI